MIENEQTRSNTANKQAGTGGTGVVRGDGNPNSKHVSLKSLRTCSKIDYLSARWIRHNKGALVVGLTDGTTHIVRGFGQVSRANHATADGDTIFELASITKVFTGLLLARMAECGEVQFSDPVTKWLPKGVHVPTYEGRCITLENLATHTSGLPRAPYGPILTESFPTRRMHLFLNECSLNTAPGSHYFYSNLGITLLGEALVNAARQRDYEQLLEQRICRPLRLKNTSTRLTASQTIRLSQGKDERGRMVPHNGLFGCGASGALKSTGNDLLTFLDAHLAPNTVPELTRALRLSLIERANSGPTERVALGWFINKVTHYYNKTGILPGYRTYIGFSRDKHLGVVVLGASDECPAAEIGETLLQELR